jgi:hypothetical protein
MNSITPPENYLFNWWWHMGGWWLWELWNLQRLDRLKQQAGRPDR